MTKNKHCRRCNYDMWEDEWAFHKGYCDACTGYLQHLVWEAFLDYEWQLPKFYVNRDYSSSLTTDKVGLTFGADRTGLYFDIHLWFRSYTLTVKWKNMLTKMDYEVA
jgi:hypothetical protein